MTSYRKTMSYDATITLQRAEEHQHQAAEHAEDQIRYRDDGEVADDDQAAPHIRDANQAYVAATFIETHWRKHS